MVIDKKLKCFKGSENFADIYCDYNKYFQKFSISQVDLKDLKNRVSRPKSFCFLFENNLGHDVSLVVNDFLRIDGGYFSNSVKFISFYSVFCERYRKFVLSGSKKNFYAFELKLECGLYSNPFRVLGKNKKVYFRALFQDCFLKNGVLCFKFVKPVFVDGNGNLTEFVCDKEDDEDNVRSFEI